MESIFSMVIAILELVLMFVTLILFLAIPILIVVALVYLIKWLKSKTD